MCLLYLAHSFPISLKAVILYSFLCSLVLLLLFNLLKFWLVVPGQPISHFLLIIVTLREGKSLSPGFCSFRRVVGGEAGDEDPLWMSICRARIAVQTSPLSSSWSPTVPQSQRTAQGFCSSPCYYPRPTLLLQLSIDWGKAGIRNAQMLVSLCSWLPPPCYWLRNDPAA